MLMLHWCCYCYWCCCSCWYCWCCCCLWCCCVGEHLCCSYIVVIDVAVVAVDVVNVAAVVVIDVAVVDDVAVCLCWCCMCLIGLCKEVHISSEPGPVHNREGFLSSIHSEFMLYFEKRREMLLQIAALTSLFLCKKSIHANRTFSRVYLKLLNLKHPSSRFPYTFSPSSYPPFPSPPPPYNTEGPRQLVQRTDSITSWCAHELLGTRTPPSIASLWRPSPWQPLPQQTMKWMTLNVSDVCALVVTIFSSLAAC